MTLILIRVKSIYYHYVLMKLNRNCFEGLVSFASVKFDSSTVHCNEPLIFHFLHLIKVQTNESCNYSHLLEG